MRTRYRAEDEAFGSRRRAPAPQPPAVEAVLALQRSAGNRAVLDVLARARTRPQRRVRATRQRGPAYLLRATGADYGAWTTSSGGTSAEVMVGPTGGDTSNYGGRPVPGECTAVERLNQNPTYRSVDKWVKGHLLNDNLGGPGISANLTPMTKTANRQHEGSFEGPVKRGITRCALLGNPQYSPIAGTPEEDYWYGVHYDVRGDGRSAYPHAGEAYARAVNRNLICNAVYVKQSKADDSRTEELDATEIANLGLPALPGPDHLSPCL